jgi:thiosulfate/3-mercaptopyruvate sulfurtransferase
LPAYLLSISSIALLVLASTVAAGTSPHENPTNHSEANPARQAAQSSDSWTARQTIEPAALVKELGSPASRPRFIACVGFRTLYEGAHVPGASFHGPAANSKGLQDLKSWAQPLPRSAGIVIYCGCCPLAHCPNLRPAFDALRDMGFKKVRVLMLRNDFAHDWVRVGYPIAKGK